MGDTPAATIAAVVAERYLSYVGRFDDITKRAPGRFAERDWRALQADARERLDAYGEVVSDTVAVLEAELGESARSREAWSDARRRYGETMAERCDLEIAETFFSSITRRVLGTVGVDDEVEFTMAGRNSATGSPPILRYPVDAALGDVLEKAVTDPDPAMRWHNLHRDVRLAVAEIERNLGLHGITAPVAEIELIQTPFYRGQGAYLVGRLRSGDTWLPLGIALHHTTRGLTIGAVLTEVEDVSVLFSYTRAAFHVEVSDPGALVAYLSAVVPTRSRDELYTAIGFRKHGKTELFRDFSRHITTSEDCFEHARGIRGMVMIVFTVPGYDMVFKIIRDRFPWPKQTTRRQIMAKYRMVAHHDRAGRLVDAHEFEHLRFDTSRFSSELLADLADNATRSVTIDDASVVLHHVYVERRLAPLDLYVREANPIKARAAIVDYGRAIKNLAAADIFPGDMLLKNFGVTRGGRVVFYDYDEIVPLTQCNFREMPESDRPDEEMSAEPWFGVGENDIFPEEFARFLGIRPELREVFDYHHGDLFGVRFWSRMQDRLSAGEVIEIFPYARGRRLGAAVRKARVPVE